MSIVTRVLLVAVVCLFLGRSYEYFFWGSPIRVLVWDQALFGPVVENIFGREWQDFVTDLAVDNALSTITKSIAAYFVLCALAAIFYFRTRSSVWAWVLRVGAVLLFLHALLNTKDHFYHFAQLFEHAIQVSTPLFFITTLGSLFQPKRMLLYVKIIVAATFIAHGLYAAGAYPVPGNFVDMTIGILGCSEATARNFLLLAGLLDFVAAGALFIPRVARVGFIYMVFWGSVTALARIVYGFDANYAWETLHGSLYKTVYRLPHGLLPLVGWLLMGHLKAWGEPKLTNEKKHLT